MSNSQSLYAITPELILLCTAILILLGDSCLSFWRKAGSLNGILALAAIVISALFSLSSLEPVRPHILAFHGALRLDRFSVAVDLLLFITAALAVLMALTYLENRRLNQGEYYALLLFATLGAMLMASANDLIVLFISLETLSVALYVLTGFARSDTRSEEAALKYFLLGAFAAGFLLYGIALVYGGSAAVGEAGTTSLSILGARMNAHIPPSFMLMAGIGLILIGLGFKAGLVPFHMWVPDVYEGAPTSVTAFMAAAVKIGAFAALIRIFTAFTPISAYWIPALQIIALLTMFGGNLLAVTQVNVKRMLAYSSIAHAGYLLIAIISLPGAPEAAAGAVVYYLLAYALMTMGAFGTLIYLSRRGRDCQTLSDLKGLWYTDPIPAYLLALFMFSLAGIPPTMGFIGKWLIFSAALQAGQAGLAIALAFASMIAIYYYLRVVWVSCFQKPDVESIECKPADSSSWVAVSLAAAASFLLLCGMIPGMVHPLMSAAQSVMR